MGNCQCLHPVKIERHANEEVVIAENSNSYSNINTQQNTPNRRMNKRGSSPTQAPCKERKPTSRSQHYIVNAKE